MKWARFIIVLLVFMLLDSGNLLNLIAMPQMRVRPDLLLIMLVFFASHCSPGDAIAISFMIGFAADVSGESWTMGPYLISFGIMGSLLCQLRKVVIVKSIVYQALAIFATGLIAGTLSQALTVFKTGDGPMNLYSAVLGTACYSAAVGPVVWLAFAALKDWLQVEHSQYGQSRNR